jgi:hypothetical protein
MTLRFFPALHQLVRKPPLYIVQYLPACPLVWLIWARGRSLASNQAEGASNHKTGSLLSRCPSWALLVAIAQLVRLHQDGHTSSYTVYIYITHSFHLPHLPPPPPIAPEDNDALQVI